MGLAVLATIAAAGRSGATSDAVAFHVGAATFAFTAVLGTVQLPPGFAGAAADETAHHGRGAEPTDAC